MKQISAAGRLLKGKGPLAAIGLTVLLWAAAYPAIGLALKGFTAFGLAALRYAIAALALLAIGRVAGIGLPPRADLPRLALVGAVGIAAYNLLLNFGQTTVNAGTAGLLININPVFAAILGSLMLHERLRLAGWTGIGISFAGAVIIATTRSDEGLSFNPGAAAILAAAFCFALQWTLQKPLFARHRPLAVTTWVIWLGTMFLLPFLPNALGDLASAPPEAIWATLFLGLGPAALAYAVWAYALAHYPVGQATSFLYLVAPVTLVMAYFLLGEIPLLATILGGALTLAGVIVVNTLGKLPRPQPRVAAASNE